MSKVTIKFWCSRKLAYEADGNNLYFVNSKGMVVMHVGLGEIRSCSQIEAHFYKYGERIA